MLWVCGAGSVGTAPCVPLTPLYTPQGATTNNPLIADANGNFAPVCVATPGRYMMQVGGTGLTTSVTDGIVIPNDPQNPTFGAITTSGQITSSVATGTAPFSIASTTQVNNLNVSQLEGKTWEAPGTIGSTTPNTGSFIQIKATSDGTVTAPAFSFNTSGSGSGLYQIAANNIGVTVNGTGKFQFLSGSVTVVNGVVLGWNSAGINTLIDTGFSRLGAAQAAFGNGTNGDFSGIFKTAIFNAVTGFQVNGAATTGNVLRGNGTNFVSAQLASTDLSDASSLTTLTGTQILTNKRVTPRVQTAADATSITPASDTADITVQTNTQVSGTLTINAPTGTPTDGQKLILRIKSTNSQTYSFNATYHFSTTVVAPTTLAAGKTDYIGCLWDATNSAWDVVAVDQGH